MSRRLVVVLVALATAVLALGGLAVAVDPTGGRDDRGPLARLAGAGPGRGMHGQVGEAAYLVEMVAHHQEAVDAAGELVRSERPRVRALGRSIVESQTAQIATMTSWLERWHPDAEAGDYRPMMRNLSGLESPELDRVFLQDMVHHHMMAVMMSRRLLMGGVEHDAVATLAQTVIEEQVAEIRLMREWRVRWFGLRYGGRVGMGHR